MQALNVKNIIGTDHAIDFGHMQGNQGKHGWSGINVADLDESVLEEWRSGAQVVTRGEKARLPNTVQNASRTVLMHFGTFEMFHMFL